MFSLIIAIVSVALIVTLIAATMYSGGDTLTMGRQEAEAAQHVNELGQISAALVAFRAQEGRNANGLAELAPSYLSSVPTGWGEALPSQTAFESTKLKGSDEQKLETCRTVNSRLGWNQDPPACATIQPNFSGCCVDNTAP